MEKLTTERDMKLHYYYYSICHITEKLDIPQDGICAMVKAVFMIMKMNNSVTTLEALDNK